MIFKLGDFVSKTTEKMVFAMVVIFLLSGCSQYKEEALIDVTHKGALKNFMMHGDISAHADLASIENVANLYALGAVENLKGEIQIFDSKPFVSTVESESLKIDQSYAKKATLLVFASVKEWHTILIQDSISSYSALEVMIAKAALENGVEIDKPFPFLVEGNVNSLDWHVIDWVEGDSVHTHIKHKKTGLNGQIKEEEVAVLGFYSNAHHAVFTHHTTNMHLHFKTANNSVAGHVDDIVLGKGMVLKLPVPESIGIFQHINNGVVAYANWIWGTPLLILLMGGGIFFVFYSRFIPYRYFFHAINVLRGKYDEPGEEGEISHYEALSTALASTVGMGNVSGVAVALTMGGPGAIFWMWVSAIIGMVTKYFTITLSVLYRGKDDKGNPQGGPMYVIEEGMGKKWKPLGIFFSLCVMVGALPIFQANQLTRIIRDVVLIPNGIDHGVTSNWIIGFTLMVIVSLVIFGGIKRIASVAGKLVPVMVVVYFISVMYIILVNINLVPASLALIFTDAFTGDAVLGGAVGSVIIIGARRAAFSNEAGIGTAPMVQGQAKTSEPVREGLVGMLGPAIDTLLVCTLTALAILITGAWKETGVDGVTVTVHAFNKAIPGFGGYVLFISVLIFAITSLFSYSYYGEKSLAYLIGTQKAKKYRIVYVLTILLGALASLSFIINVIDAFYAMMAIPTMISALWLAPKVMEETKKYVAKMKKKGIL